MDCRVAAVPGKKDLPNIRSLNAFARSNSNITRAATRAVYSAANFGFKCNSYSCDLFNRFINAINPQNLRLIRSIHVNVKERNLEATLKTLLGLQ